MMDETKTPQEKKRLSYAKDRRNTYRENSKASRKSIPLSKARAIRRERHAQDHALAVALDVVDSDAMAAVENTVRATAPRTWRKDPDTPLGDVLKRRASRNRTAEE
jgi:hypothetical protein